MIRKIALICILGSLLTSCNSNAQEVKKETFNVQKTEEEWKADLTPEQFYILRQAGTERPGSSPLNYTKEKGTFQCAGCQAPLFTTANKFDSGTGWPSFDQPIEGKVAYSTDRKLGYTRTEEHCANCGGHLGHVFNDGPRNTTGQRHCINGDALIFVPDSE